MTERWPRYQARSAPEVSGPLIAAVQGFKTRHARLINGVVQSIPDAADTVVQFGASKVVAYDDLEVGAVWDGTAHAWVMPDDAGLVRLHAEVRLAGSGNAGDVRAWVRRGSDDYGRVEVQRGTVSSAVVVQTPVLLADAGDQFTLYVHQATGGAVNAGADCAFTLEIVET